MELDILVFAAHPDDAELSMGGTIAKFTSKGLKVGVADLSKAELSTRGNVKLRAKETAAASKILNLKAHENLGIPDGNILASQENLRSVVVLIRKYKPKIVFAPYSNDRHPDHMDVSNLVKRAFLVLVWKNSKQSLPESPRFNIDPKSYFIICKHICFNQRLSWTSLSISKRKWNQSASIKASFIIQGQKGRHIYQ
ncbi:MAG: PIG-L family deacetylase [Ignavibacteriaceae bacterium]|nr:PIG-L family deacetylase [Ignavibacteriaceae bacterium]